MIIKKRLAQQNLVIILFSSTKNLYNPSFCRGPFILSNNKKDCPMSSRTDYNTNFLD